MPQFEHFSKEIYPNELNLEKVNVQDRKLSFLDVELKISSPSELLINVYDKTEAFNFDVIKFSHISSNIPDSVSYGVFLSQLVRIARICNRDVFFMDRAKLLTNYMVKQGYSKEKLLKVFFKFFENHKTLAIKHSMADRKDVIKKVSVLLK